ncbi:hypothetical protein BUALT_Bualt16G0018500 [Buddleja alternifolia]|uniref:Uncharacterized protein n=1 Tax=Buddleja alternifolia TaxID=168488 RepID=A0AAV6WA26_9LAMI|nr:hypothetical protein BUALT_Bualt16G0018500 [Buddleja alternifolia]
MPPGRHRVQPSLPSTKPTPSLSFIMPLLSSLHHIKYATAVLLQIEARRRPLANRSSSSLPWLRLDPQPQQTQIWKFLMGCKPKNRRIAPKIRNKETSHSPSSATAGLDMYYLVLPMCVLTFNGKDDASSCQGPDYIDDLRRSFSSQKMKFGKKLTSQMVQEWQEAYMDYNHLKKLLKDIMNAPPFSSPTARKGHPKRKLTMYGAFSGLTARHNNLKKNADEVIVVSLVQQEGSEDYYKTMFMSSSEEVGENELSFFGRLDDEFNKVMRFYRTKVKDVKLEAEELSKRMDALIALRMKVDKSNVEQKVEIASVKGENQKRLHMDVIQEVDMSTETTSLDELMRADKDFKNDNTIRPASPEILDHVKINIDPDTPVSTLRNLTMSSKSDLSFSKEELRKSEEKLKRAFIDFYQQLLLLKSYCFLNMLAFSKIMKKYDKITSRNSSRTYLEVVDNSYLGSSNEVNDLIESLDATFIQHFANGNRREGMKSLRPGDQNKRHRSGLNRTTFFLGLFTGCSMALIAGIVVSIHARNLLHHEGRGQYMDNIFPLYREIFLLASGLSVLALAAILSNLDMEMDPETQRFQTLTELVPLGLVTVLLLITVCPLNIIYRSSRFFLIRCAWRCICAPHYKVTFSDFFLADQLTSQVQAFRSLQFYICYYGWGDFRRRSNRCLDSNIYEALYIVVAIIPFWSRVLQCLRRLFEEKNPRQGLNSLKYFSTVVALVMRTLYDLRRETFWRIMAASSSGVTTIYSTYWDIVIDWGLLQRNAKNPWLRDELLISNKAVYFVAIVVNILLRLVWMQLVLDFNEAPFLHRRAMVAVVACLEIVRRGIWNFFRFGCYINIILHVILSPDTSWSPPMCEPTWTFLAVNVWAPPDSRQDLQETSRPPICGPHLIGGVMLENEHFHNVGKYRASKSAQFPLHHEDEKIM